MTDKEKLARIQTEACALAHVLHLGEADRAAAAEKLGRAVYALPAWLLAVCREIDTAPAVGLPALWAVLNRAGMDKERAALAAAGVTLENLLALDPADGRRVYDAALADTKRAGIIACADTARDILAGMPTAKTETERRDLVLAAMSELNRADADPDGTLADAWQKHLELMAADVAGAAEVLRLNDNMRGTWAGWVNDCLGPRAGLEPGQTFVLGGAPEAGKTSLAALLAVDALAVGCPVLFWQLELSREETLEHLQAQRPELGQFWKKSFWSAERARRPLPDDWADLLTVPRWAAPEVEAILAAMQTMTRNAERAGKARHKCRGLVVVDYAQLLTVADAGPRNAQHDILCTAASRLAKAAAENNACLLLLSQINKQEQRDGTAGGTALAGADLARMAHRVALLQKAGADGKACKDGDAAAWETGNGEKRLLTWTKRRGMRYTDGRRPKESKVIWYAGQSRALHGGDAAAIGGDA